MSHTNHFTTSTPGAVALHFIRRDAGALARSGLRGRAAVRGRMAGGGSFD